MQVFSALEGPGRYSRYWPSGGHQWYSGHHPRKVWLGLLFGEAPLMAWNSGFAGDSTAEMELKVDKQYFVRWKASCTVLYEAKRLDAVIVRCSTNP